MPVINARIDDPHNHFATAHLSLIRGRRQFPVHKMPGFRRINVRVGDPARLASIVQTSQFCEVGIIGRQLRCFLRTEDVGVRFERGDGRIPMQRLSCLSKSIQTGLSDDLPRQAESAENRKIGTEAIEN